MTSQPSDRIKLASWPTPLEPAPRLTEALGLGPDDLWIKRDDLTGLAGGGNKIRKLEGTVAAAIAAGADALVTPEPRKATTPRLTAAAGAASDCGWCWCSPAIRVGRKRETSRW
jgi:1-aminocyclopropane-1-carboxylate deaminase/D-cysteine desulfhydrase-like pyridoxal-dependent ACC family enzyme